MRIRSAFVVVLSLAALAAAAQLGALAPTAAPEASTSDDGDESLPPQPPPPILRGVGATRPPSAEQAQAWHLARADAEFGAVPDAEGSGFDAPPAPLWDATTRQIVGMTSALRRFKDDEAIRYVDLSDDAYEIERTRAEARRTEALTAGDGRGASAPRLPPRGPKCVDEWITVEGSLAERSARRRGLLETDDDSTQPAATDVAAIVETERLRIQRERRRAAREYKFEVTRLRSDLLREYADHRDRRRKVSTWDDISELVELQRKWQDRWDKWCSAEPDSPEDQREVETLVRTIPSRILDDSDFIVKTPIAADDTDATE